MKHLILLLVAFTAICFSSSAQEWTSKGEKNGIKGVYRVVNGEYQMRLTTSVNVTLGACVGLLKDASAYPKWMDGASTSRLLKEPNPSEMYFYGTSDMPWPISDRDFAMHGTVSQDPATKVVKVNSTTVPTYYPEQKEYVRLKYYKINMILTPVKPGQTQIQLDVSLNTKEGLPEWLINWFAADRLFDTLHKFRQLVQTESYKNFKHPKIQEPG